MQSSSKIAIAVLCALMFVPVVAAGDRAPRFSGFFGVRTTSEVSALGTPTTTSVGNALGLGPRLRFDLWRWFSVETELGLFPSSTRANDVSVFVADPRAHVTFALPAQGNFQPKLLLGVGAPLALSANTSVLQTGIQFEGYLGGSVEFSRGGGLGFRLDIHIHGGPGRNDSALAMGSEFLIGISYRSKTRVERGLPPLAGDRDTDNDGISDAKDKCPKRPEDKDGYQDEDGCPDIDNDLDEVLDVADKCPLQPETHNGYQDDDGCPDTLPDDLAAIVGTLKGVVFYPRTSRLHRRSRYPLRKLVKVLKKYPRVRIRLIGHTDNKGDADAKLVLSTDRAKVVEKWLVRAGIDAERIQTQGRGGAQPAFENDTRRNRFKNNRVVVELVARKR